MREEGNINRLPKWAQHEITRLRADLYSAKRKLGEGPEDSRVFANPYSDNPRPLGRAGITFLQDTDDAGKLASQGFKVQMKDDGKTLEVYGGDHQLQVEPVASNVVHIRLRRW